MENKNPLDKLKKIIENEVWLVEILKLVRSLNLPDCFVAAGSIRNTIFDSLHEFTTKTPLKDIDVVYFDSLNMSEKKDLSLQKHLEDMKPEFKWELINQARVHLFKDVLNKKFKEIRKKAHSTADSISFWSETATCIGVRLEKDNSITMCAPHGVNDLMELKIRPIPEPYQDMELYNHRLNEKQWKKYWPKLIITQN